MIRIPKKHVLRIVAQHAPEYASIFYQLKIEGGRLPFRGRVANARNRLGNYVQFYENEAHIGAAVMIGAIGEEAYRAWVADIRTLQAEEQERFLCDWIESEKVEEWGDILDLPDSEAAWEEALQATALLPDAQRKELAKRGEWLFCGALAGFFNTLSVMVHGAKLTALVPAAIDGDDEALLKAVQIDRCLVTHHPYFIERKQRAQDIGEPGFLRQLAYREANPPLKGRVRYPGLYLVFAQLESLGWLQDLTHSEILDLCDEAGLDRYQNRIEDVNYVSKRLKEYREFQNSNGMSMLST